MFNPLYSFGYMKQIQLKLKLMVDVGVGVSVYVMNPVEIIISKEVARVIYHIVAKNINLVTDCSYRSINIEVVKKLERYEFGI